MESAIKYYIHCYERHLFSQGQITNQTQGSGVVSLLI